jgi:hypothetical protein
MASVLRAILLCFLVALALVLVCGGCVVVYQHECVKPGDDARRLLVPWIGYLARTEYEIAGAIRDPTWLDHQAAGLRPYEQYSIRVRRSKRGDEVVIAPRHLCFCRPTFILYDQSRRLEIVGE